MDNNSNSKNLEQKLQDIRLYRHLNAFIIAHLHDNNLIQVASVVASATMTPLSVEVPTNKLLDLVAKGLAMEKDETLRGGVSSNTRYDSTIPAPRLVPVDFSVVHDTKGASKIFPKHEARHISEHKGVLRCAKFSPDGRFITGSADTSIKLFEVISLVSKVKKMMLPDAGDAPVRTGIQTLYDHLQPVNDLDFHPQNRILISGAKDRTIKFFDFSKTVVMKAFKIIQDIRSVSFHPAGEFLLAGTDHPIAHLFDVNTIQCYLSATVQETGINAVINQVRYSSTGGMYVTASKDGAIRLWDGVTSQCVRSILNAHGSA